MLKKIYLLVVLTIFLFASCSNPYPEEKNKTVFRYNESAGISSLDPAFARDQANIWACNQIYNGLVQLDDSLHVKPAIATSWDISPDGKNYIFHLRNDVSFHNHERFEGGKGRKVRATDFVYSLQRVLDEKTLSPGAQWLNTILEKDTKGKYFIQAFDDTTLVIKLKQAFSPFLGRLSMPYFSVIPKEVAEFYGKDFSRHPVGTGPFCFKLWKEGVKLVLLKNPDYFEKENGQNLPYLDAVSISFIIDKQSVFLEFVKGNIDFISGLDASYKDELLNPDGKIKSKYQNKFTQLTSPYLNTEYLGILIPDKNSKEEKISPLAKVQIRKAINYGFDRKKMIQYLRNNIGEAGIHGFVPTGMPGFGNNRTQGYDFQPDSVRKLLAEAGFPNGKGLPPIILSTTASYLDLCKYIQQQLGLFGIPVEVETNQAAALRTMIAQSKIPFFRASWIGDYADPENYLSLFYSQNKSPKGSNTTHFDKPIFDKLYEKALFETNDSIRLLYQHQMDQMVMNEAPVVILFYDQVLRFTQKNVQNLGCNAMNLLSLKRVKK